MSWNGKNTEITVDPNILWGDYFDENRIDAFIETLESEIREFVEKRLGEEFSEDYKAGEVCWNVNVC